jgi:hypothetical protein
LYATLKFSHPELTERLAALEYGGKVEDDNDIEAKKAN